MTVNVSKRKERMEQRKNEKVGQGRKEGRKKMEIMSVNVGERWNERRKKK